MDSGTVTVHALSSGYLTLPERFFVTPLDPSVQDARRTVPSLSFLIQHHSPGSQNPTRLIFDLGLRRDLSLYSQPIQTHAETRKPLSLQPDVVQSLSAGGLQTDDIDFVLLSHVHWDHIGYPADFRHATFVVGNGALGLLDGSRKLVNGSHSYFEAGLLPLDRTVELADPGARDGGSGGAVIVEGVRLSGWAEKAMFPHAIDMFGDGSCLVVSAPGHLPGHINLLCRTSQTPVRYVLLAGDACHDRRLLTKEKEIAEWEDPNLPGVVCCMHAEKEVSVKTLAKISAAEAGESEALGRVEVIFAHDPVWDAEAKKQGRFWPGKL